MPRMVLKDELAGDALFLLIQKAVFDKHRKSKTLKKLMEKGTAKIVTRVELKLHGPLKLSNITAIVEILEQD